MHQAANTLNYDLFIKLDGENMEVLNDFNCSNETPIDICLKLFPYEGL
jgi:hypothetical protein